MPQTVRSSNRALRALVLAAAVGAAVPVVAGGVAACITSPPPDLPELPLRGPRILEDGVRPVTDQYLTGLPADDKFVVPVEVTDTTRPIVGRVFVDFNPGPTNMPPTTNYVRQAIAFPTLDGGVTNLSFSLSPANLGDPTACHIIEFIVAGSFDEMSGSSHTPTPGDNLGGDSVSWFYTPNGPNGCFAYDASDGSAVQGDSSQDGPPLPDGTGTH